GTLDRALDVGRRRYRNHHFRPLSDSRGEAGDLGRHGTIPRQARFPPAARGSGVVIVVGLRLHAGSGSWWDSETMPTKPTKLRSVPVGARRCPLGPPY